MSRFIRSFSILGFWFLAKSSYARVPMHFCFEAPAAASVSATISRKRERMMRTFSLTNSDRLMDA
jgi:hypothetical protein